MPSVYSKILVSFQVVHADERLNDQYKVNKLPPLVVISVVFNKLETWSDATHGGLVTKKAGSPLPFLPILVD